MFILYLCSQWISNARPRGNPRPMQRDAPLFFNRCDSAEPALALRPQLVTLRDGGHRVQADMGEEDG
ncbi:hypothetical protein J7373_12865 [Xanthomonas sp. A2111]|uniref:Uncharacterized protein n=1 Tax=Xanthomonas hawaiiensis TaxID=3003247 RepID=A0ABU2IA10_9XANT|nr:hypothetical protein [Xanthomonas sp. A2111]MBO9829143.1 hypothetical protein [Xanthomonas sp. A2111]MDS9994975.1 hypothetical protein [Xanthomonas sp. A2111]